MNETDLARFELALRTGTPDEQLDAADAVFWSVDRAYWRSKPAPPLVDALAGLLTSRVWRSVGDERPGWGHASLADRAMRIISMMSVAPPIEKLRRALADHSAFTVPEAAYDQGAYIGDYGRETIAPAGLAAQLVSLLEAGGFALLPELIANTTSDEPAIQDPAWQAIRQLVHHVGAASTEQRAELMVLAERLDAMPEVRAGRLVRDMDLRGLAALLRIELAASR